MFTVTNSACYMEQPSRVNRSIATASRTLRLVTVQELLLEYSLIVIVLAFSFLLSAIPKIFRVAIAGEIFGVCLVVGTGEL